MEKTKRKIGFKTIILKGISLSMGVATLVLNILKEAEVSTSFILLSIGLICLTIDSLEDKKL